MDLTNRDSFEDIKKEDIMVFFGEKELNDISIDNTNKSEIEIFIPSFSFSKEHRVKVPKKDSTKYYFPLIIDIHSKEKDINISFEYSIYYGITFKNKERCNEIPIIARVILWFRNLSCVQ